MHTPRRHLLIELYDCDPAALADPPALLAALHAAAAATGSTVLAQCSHAFSPEGFTAVLLLAESHIALHTWPEERFVAADVFTCGASAPDPAAEVLSARLGARRVQTRAIERGPAGTTGGDPPPPGEVPSRPA